MQLKPFQKQDLARLALHDGAILAWDTGLGKTWAFLLWSMLKAGHEFKGGTLLPKAPCLIVAPGDLHAQMADEAWTHFRIRFIKLDSQAAFLQLSTLSPVDGQRSLPAGFYITSYTQLSTNGVPEVPDVAKMPAESWLAFFSLNQDHVAEYYARRGHHLRRYYELLESSPEDSLPTLQMRLRRLTCNASEFAQHAIHAAYEQLAPFHIDANNPLYSELPPNNRDIITSRFATHTYFEYTRHIGDTSSLPNQRRVKCIYAPTLADLCFNSFTCVAVDEGTRMKGENTLVGLGVRQLTPKYRLVSTATPIKNRLPDIFRLAWWVTGGREEAHARFPYANSSADRGDFAEEFLVSEHNLSAKKRRNPRYKKLTPNVCNVHRLWKMMAPIILRRRKHDIGEQIVSKHRHVIRAAMGTHQAETYKYHLRASYLDKNGRPAPGAKLQALRMAAAAPHAENLVPVLNGKGSHRSHTGYIPKIASALNLINQILRRGEQVVVGSAFIEPLNTLSCLLKEANVRHLRMDGSVSQTRRGMLSAQFKQGGPKYNPHASAKNLYPVTLAGVESCAEGHNWSRGKNVILIGFSWAFDKFEQLINRVHRLNSPEDVHVYKEEEAYNIFETLNDRGLRLSVPDLVANLLLKRCAGDAARKAVREQWNALLQQMGKRDVSRFLRHYWISRFGDVKSRGLYSEIKDHLAANKIDSLTFASGCTEECEDYVKLIDLSVPVSKWVIRDLEAMVKHHGALSSMPLLLSGYRCLNSSDFEKLLKCVVALYVRYSLITNQDPAGLETAFFNAAREIRSKHESKVVSAKCLAAAKAILNKINPTDALVEEKGKELILPEGAAKWFVTELANAVQSKTKEIGMDKANVEHIFPQNAGAEWPTRKQLEPLIWHVGNLTILGRRINTKAQNKAFKEKCKEHYSKSEIKMTTELLKETDWTPEVIHKRAANLAKQMTHLWQ